MALRSTRRRRARHPVGRRADRRPAADRRAPRPARRRRPARRARARARPAGGRRRSPAGGRRPPAPPHRQPRRAAARSTRSSTPSASASATRSASRRCAWRSIPTRRARSSCARAVGMSTERARPPEHACRWPRSRRSSTRLWSTTASCSSSARTRTPASTRRCTARRSAASAGPARPPGSSMCCWSRCATARAGCSARCGSTTRRIGCCPRRRRMQSLRAFANHAMGAIESARQLELMRHLAEHDPLTGLRNRRGLQEHIDAEIARTGSVAVLVCDLDNFKRVNDALGYVQGDEALRRFAGVLARAGGLAARLGGEEFALVLGGIGEDAALATAERVRAEVSHVFDDFPWPVTTSVGVAVSGPGAETASLLLRAATRAVFGAKRLGRDRCIPYHAETLEPLLGTLEDAGGASDEQLAAAMLLAETLDLRDVGTARHSQTVGRYAEAIARALELPDEPRRPHPRRRRAARPRQARRRRRRAQEAGQAHRRGVGRDAPAPRARRAHPPPREPARHQRLGARPPRADRRLRLPARPGGARDPARGADPRRRRRLRGDDRRPRIPRRARARRGPEGAARVRRHAVRPARRRRVPARAQRRRGRPRAVRAAPYRHARCDTPRNGYRGAQRPRGMGARCEASG